MVMYELQKHRSILRFLLLASLSIFSACEFIQTKHEDSSVHPKILALELSDLEANDNLVEISLFWEVRNAESNVRIIRRKTSVDPVEETVLDSPGSFDPALNAWFYVDKIPHETNEQYTYQIQECHFDHCDGEIPLALLISSPPRPEGLSLQNTAQSIDLNFGPVSGARLYRIFRSLDSINYFEIETINPRASLYRTYRYTDSNVSIGGNYYYKIRAENDLGQSSFSEAVMVRFGEPSEVPLTPSNLRVTGTGTISLTLAWNDVTEETSFKLFNNGTLVMTASENTTSYTFTGLSASTTYTFGIEACNRVGCSAHASLTATTSAASPTVPALPTNFRQIATSANSISVAWDQVTEKTAFKLYNNGTLVLIVSQNASSYTFTGLSASTTYTLGIEACNGPLCSARVNLSATTSGASAAAPLAPTNFRQIAATANSVTMAWNDVTEETSFKLFNNGTLVMTASENTTSYTFTGLAASTTYTFGIEACNGAGCSARASLTVTTSAASPTVPALPTNFRQTSALATSISVEWNTVTEATEYKLFKNNIFETIVGTSGTFGSFSGLTASTTYTLGIEACNVGGCSARVSITATTSAPPVPPSSPRNLRVTSTTVRSVSLAWDGVTGAYRYKIYKADTLVIEFVSTDSSVTREVGLLNPSTTYIFGVEACTNDLCSARVTVQGTTSPVAPPQNLRILRKTYSSITLMWEFSPSSGDSYKIYKDSTLVGTVPDQYYSTEYKIDSLAQGEYTFGVKACIGTICSVLATVVGSPDTHPDEPTNFRVTSKTRTSISFAWDDSAGETSYELAVQSVIGTVTFEKSTAQNTTTATFSNLQPGTTYKCYVRGRNAAGYSDFVSLDVSTNP